MSSNQSNSLENTCSIQTSEEGALTIKAIPKDHKIIVERGGDSFEGYERDIEMESMEKGENYQKEMEIENSEK